ncbi:hypothetical protein TWF751_012129 [Orbilia oligospora]|nr:hypothetical protein TWF751_012129 [Orbilia oligospora]
MRCDITETEQNRREETSSTPRSSFNLTTSLQHTTTTKYIFYSQRTFYLSLLKSGREPHWTGFFKAAFCLLGSCLKHACLPACCLSSVTANQTRTRKKAPFRTYTKCGLGRYQIDLEK